MKFSITTFFFTLLSSAPVAVAFTTNGNHNNLKVGGRLPTFGSSSVLGSTATATGNIAASTVNDATVQDDTVTLQRKEALGFSEDDLRQAYSDWLMQYGKVADESRYVTYKKNFLLQEEYNQKVGASFTLNEYGDMTEKEFRAMKSQTVVVEPPKEESVEVVEEIPNVENNHNDVVEEEEDDDEESFVAVVEELESTISKDEHDVAVREVETVEIIDETDDIFVEKYTSIENIEERAFEVLKDFNFVKPAPQHFSFSYVDETPELRLENGSTYMDALHNPKLSALEGSSASASKNGMMMMSSSAYLSSMPASESGTFEKGKKQDGKNALSSSMAYLDDICDMLEPFMDCSKQSRTPIKITSPVEDAIYERVSQMKALGDKAFQVLVELCSIGRCERN